MKKSEILTAFKKLNEKLKGEDSKAEMCLVGGAVMCLVFNARQQTQDVDAIFYPKAKVYRIAKEIAEEMGLAEDWLNDSAKAYLNAKFEQVEVLVMSHLAIFAPSAKYLLAMKCLAARIGTKDETDIEFLIEYLGLTRVDEVMSIVSSFYEVNLIQPKVQGMVAEIVAGL